MKPFTFIYGDDYLAQTKAQELFNEKKQAREALSCEQIDGNVDNLGKLESLAKRIQASIQTLSLFQETKLVWLKNVNFLADNSTAKAEGAKPWLELIRSSLLKIDPKFTEFIISAESVDRRTKEFKWFQEQGNCIHLQLEKDEAIISWIHKSFETENLKITHEAAELLLSKIENNPRLLSQEINKLCTYKGSENNIVDAKIVHDLVPQFGEGDFFELVEAFFSKDLAWTLDAIKHYFFLQKEPRVILSALQNRNRLLIQLKSLSDAGILTVHEGGISKSTFESLKKQYDAFFESFETKSVFNLFTQNTWYLGQIAKKSLHQWTRKELMAIQQKFISYFESLIAHPNDAKQNLEYIAIQSLKSI